MSSYCLTDNDVILCAFQFSNDTYVTVGLQCKIYANASQGHVTWGNELHFIECSFRAQDDKVALSCTQPVFR